VPAASARSPSLTMLYRSNTARVTGTTAPERRVRFEVRQACAAMFPVPVLPDEDGAIDPLR